MSLVLVGGGILVYRSSNNRCFDDAWASKVPYLRGRLCCQMPAREYVLSRKVNIHVRVGLTDGERGLTGSVVFSVGELGGGTAWGLHECAAAEGGAGRVVGGFGVAADANEGRALWKVTVRYDASFSWNHLP